MDFKTLEETLHVMATDDHPDYRRSAATALAVLITDMQEEIASLRRTVHALPHLGGNE